MTGVSLAGTQLRVNEYKMHDAEWNDVKVKYNINYARYLGHTRIYFNSIGLNLQE